MAELVSVAIVGYLLGSIPVGYLMGRLRGIDVRRYGSGATGGTNVLRTLGPWAALVTVLGDIGKGLLAAYLGERLAGEWGFVAAGLLASLGHSFPVWLGFRGGKSVATSGGVMLLHYPLSVLIGILAGALAVVPTRWVSLGSLTATLVVVLQLFLLDVPVSHRLLAVALGVVIYVRHWENMKRIAAGTENRLGMKARPRA
ncbi:MAG: glycerol-3-phosphate 1-O-acyltransferase PlsY [Bacillota bacterium]|nr:MAG: acyl-phosphate glycerol 3-phosphate acyltransferase [Bacillota bacterium]